jgi:hypothetical protein
MKEVERWQKRQRWEVKMPQERQERETEVTSKRRIYVNMSQHPNEEETNSSRRQGKKTECGKKGEGER